MKSHRFLLWARSMTARFSSRVDSFHNLGKARGHRPRPQYKPAAIAMFLLLGGFLFGQGSLDPAKLLQPPTDSWPTYNGDYSGRRYSTLTKINAGNINSLTLAWV